MENDVGAAVAQRRPIGSSAFGDVSDRQDSEPGRAADAASISTVRGETPTTGRQRDLTRAQENRSAMTAGPMVIGHDDVSLDECADGIDVRSPPARRRRVA